jgi:hypothetical protein
LTIPATPERLVALYLDYEHWAQLFPATIRGVRLVRSDATSMTVEVDHRSEGHVINIIELASPIEWLIRRRVRRFVLEPMRAAVAGPDGA